MRNLNISIVDVDEKNVDDALEICTFPSVRNEASYLRGCEIRKNWLLNVCKTVGPCAKIAYVRNKPVGMIEYTPLHVIPYFRTKKKDTLHSLHLRSKETQASRHRFSSAGFVD